MPPEGRCVASVRRFVRDIATDWKATQDAPEIAELLTSELVANALVHGTVDIPTATIRIAVARDGELMTVDVYDPSMAIPQMRRADGLDVSGRGLNIVDDLSHKWGCNLNTHGKSVWFQLRAWPHDRGTD
jgi:anti-sigma regulatory factor (Ser/Thr protein kinase)